ncbi:MAG: hypothetical protein LBG43_05710 [Treponema sp.]|jgi:hypothetical protein|nr:hypothetical protein [Treponema sp.]
MGTIIADSDIDQVFDFLTEDEVEKAVHEQKKRNRELRQQVKDNADATFAAKLEALRNKKEILN